jgi:hypothetical protein
MAFHKPLHQLRFGTNGRVAKLAIDVAALRVAALIAFPTVGVDARQDKPVHAPLRPLTTLQPAEGAFDTPRFFTVNPCGNQYRFRLSPDFSVHVEEWVAPHVARLLYSPFTPR